MTKQIKNDSFFKSNKGFSLLETIVALFIVTMALGSLLTLYAQSLGIQKLVSDKYTAIFLANQGMEIVKNAADNEIANGSDFINVVVPATNNAAVFASQPLTGAFNRFTRVVEIDRGNPPSDFRFNVTSTVSWPGRNAIQRVRSVYFIFNANLHD